MVLCKSHGNGIPGYYDRGLPLTVIKIHDRSEKVYVIELLQVYSHGIHNILVPKYDIIFAM
jgi:hypothetical protein